MEMSTLLTIGQVAREAQVNVQTLCYYERRKIVVPSARRESGYRLYDRSAVNTVQFIKRAQQLGFSLEDIQDLLGLKAGRPAQCAKVRSKAESALGQIESRISQLESMRRALKSLIRACGKGKTQTTCPILDRFESAEGGAQ